VGREFDDLSGRVIAAAIDVHERLGPGFVEQVYENALRIELVKRKIPFESQKRIEIRYDGVVVGRHTLDLLVGGNLIVELKAVLALEEIHLVQVKSYLKAIGSNTGLLLNFGTTSLDIRRAVVHFEPSTGAKPEPQ